MAPCLGRATNNRRLSTGGLPTDRLYTGQTFDDATGLYHYGARSYDPYLGRFVSPDSLVPDPSNPQALNRYSYTLNNPVKYTDPDGHWVHIAVGAAFGGAIAYGVQVVGNVHDNGLSVEAFTNVDVRTVAAGAVAGGVGAATFGLATAAVGAVGVKGAGAAVAANVVSGRVAGVASDLVMGEDALAGLTDVGSLAWDAGLPAGGRILRSAGLAGGEGAHALGAVSSGLSSVQHTQRAFAPGRWLDHFQKHGPEFGYKNSVDYLRGAQRLTSGGEGILTHTRKGGDTLFYNPSTNEFAVLANDGATIRTYFKPVDGLQYWLDQTRGS